MIIGVIDIGTNTFHLLVADRSDNMKILHKEKVAVRLGKGGISEDVIQPDAMDRAMRTLADFKRTADSLGVEQMTVTATSAVRSAKNQSEFIELVSEKTGFKVNVLSGHDEAALIHQGVSEYIDFGNDTALIMDIGGGSIEFVIADKNEVKWLGSYEMGGQRLIDRFHQSDPISSEEISGLTDYLVQGLEEVFKQCKKFGAAYLIGSSGSFDTFWDIYSEKPEAKSLERPELDIYDFELIHEELIQKNRMERLEIPGMIDLRVDMIVSASIATSIVLKHCHFKRIKVSPYALKEGVLYHGLPKTK